MNEEVFDCVYNLWTGFVGKETCEAGFLRCEELSCPAYTPRSKPKPITKYDLPDRIVQTNSDRIRAMSDEKLASYLAHIDSPHRMPYSRWEMCEWLAWLKSPVEEGEG